LEEKGPAGAYRELPNADNSITHEYDELQDDRGCTEDISELSGAQLCGPTAKVKPGRREPAKEVSQVTAASLASNEHLPTNVFLHHVRYEIGEHPLADIVMLTGGGSIGVPVLVGTLVPGGKAEQAGVAAGDELVAISGRPDFQKMPADRLLESLPTPTLLVFAKDANLSQTNQQVSDKGPHLRGHSELWKMASAPQHADGFANFPSYGGEGLEASERHTPGWLNSNSAVEGSAFNVVGEGDGGFAGASWEVGINLDPVLGEQTAAGISDDMDMAWRQTISSKRAAGITRYNTEPAHHVQHESEPSQKPPAVQLAIIQRDGMAAAGLPSGHSLFGPNVQVELCDQVVFNPKATLWMQGIQRNDSPAASSPWPLSAARLPEPGRRPEGDTAWMYELPRQEARRLVETARRDASRADRSSSRADTNTSRQDTSVTSEPGTLGTISDLDALAFSREAKALVMSEGEAPDRLAWNQQVNPQLFDIATPEGTFASSGLGLEQDGVYDVNLAKGGTIFVGNPFSGRIRTALNPNAGPSASSTMSSTSPLAPTVLFEAPSPKLPDGAKAAKRLVPCKPLHLNGPRLGPTGARANPPSRVDPPDADDTASPEEPREDPSLEFTTDDLYEAEVVV